MCVGGAWREGLKNVRKTYEGVGAFLETYKSVQERGTSGFLRGQKLTEYC